MNTPIKCILCKRHSGSGISILGNFICDECEKALVNIDINDDRYDEYKNMIKKNIYGNAICNNH